MVNRWLPIRMAILHHLTPPRIFVLSFALVILAGAFLLWLPVSASKGHLRFVDALFSSASAVCVTGLTVVDVGKDLSIPGQVLTLLLFQVGGLGIITFSVVVFGMMGRGVSFRGREIMQSTFLPTPRRDFIVIVQGVLRLTSSSRPQGRSSSSSASSRISRRRRPSSTPLQRRLGLQTTAAIPLFRTA